MQVLAKINWMTENAFLRSNSGQFSKGFGLSELRKVVVKMPEEILNLEV
jgi:hypothetical protein